MTDHLAQRYQTPEWFDADAAAGLLEPYSQITILDTAYSTAGTLGVAENLGRIPRQISSVYEFGSSFGGGLVALDMFARACGGAVVRGSEVLSPIRDIAEEIAAELPSVAGVD